jgi:hypothetical protein
MSHFAKVENGIVTQVIVAEQDFIESGAVGDPATWIQTSYNTRGGIHYGANGQPDNGIPLRKNYAAIGDCYNAEADAFYTKRPYPSWSLDKNTFLWNPPSPHPGTGLVYYWDEGTLSWQEIGAQ